MCWRQVSRLHKLVLLAIFYVIVYVIIVFTAPPQPLYTFVSKELSVGDKYIYMYLISKSPVFSDAEGADVFAWRRCGRCFLTNNPGFLPASLYDAVLVHGDRDLLYRTSAFMDPQKRYLVETSEVCLRKKLVECVSEPTITSFTDGLEYDLCSLCQHLTDRAQHS